MPIYEWICKNCEHVTEEIRKFSEANEPCVCEKCSSENTERKTIPENTTHILKGKGWARDGYK
jgi:putative FmdB family regulatory protein